MSVHNNPAVDQYKQYNNILGGLKTGRRLVHRKDTNTFLNVFSIVAKILAKIGNLIGKIIGNNFFKDNFTTDLPNLKEKISEFLDDYKPSDKAKQGIKSAFDKRANDLANRKLLFGEEKREKAVNQLRDISLGIEQSQSLEKPKKSIEELSAELNLQPPQAASWVEMYNEMNKAFEELNHYQTLKYDQKNWVDANVMVKGNISMPEEEPWMTKVFNELNQIGR